MRHFHIRHYNRSFQPLLRAITIISSVAVLATGVTFAALQSQQAVLAGNSISTGTADLRIGTTPGSFGTSRSGFIFGDVVPGSAAVPATGNSFYLKNYGSTVLAIKLGISSTPVNNDNVDLGKTYLTVTRVDTNASQKFPLAALIAGGTTAPLALADNLSAGTVAEYRTRVSMDTDAFTGQSADIGGIDLVLTGTAATE